MHELRLFAGFMRYYKVPLCVCTKGLLELLNCIILLPLLKINPAELEASPIIASKCGIDSCAKPTIIDSSLEVEEVVGNIVYHAYGIRNSFGIDFDPVTGKLWDTENGPNYGDEINLFSFRFTSLKLWI